MISQHWADQRLSCPRGAMEGQHQGPLRVFILKEPRHLLWNNVLGQMLSVNIFVKVPLQVFLSGNKDNCDVNVTNHPQHLLGWQLNTSHTVCVPLFNRIGAGAKEQWMHKQVPYGQGNNVIPHAHTFFQAKHYGWGTQVRFLSSYKGPQGHCDRDKLLVSSQTWATELEIYNLTWQNPKRNSQSSGFLGLCHLDFKYFLICAVLGGWRTLWLLH